MSTTITLTALSTTSIYIEYSHLNPNLGDGDTDIQRSTDNATWATIDSLNNDGYYTDTGLTTSTLYYYRVKKVDWTCWTTSESESTL